MRTGTERRVARRRRPLLAEEGVAESRGPVAEGTERALGHRGDRRVGDRTPLGGRSAGRPGKEPVGAVRRGVEAEAQILRRQFVRPQIEIEEPEERKREPRERRVDCRRRFGREPGAQVCVDHHRHEVLSVHAETLWGAARCDDLAGDRPGLELIREPDELCGKVFGRGAADAAVAKAGQRPGHLPQDIALEGVGIGRHHNRVEQEPLDVAGMSQRIGQRELRAVRDSEERDLVQIQRGTD